MRPSRHLPRRKPPGKITWLGWVFLSVCGAAAVYSAVAFMRHSAWTALGLGLFMAAMTVASVVTHRKIKHLRETRRGDGICAFARSLPIRDLDTWVVRATYEEMAVYMGSEKAPFPVHASDRLKDDLEIDGDDLLAIIYAIAERAGRTVDDLEQNPVFQKMKTVEDLIKVMMWQKKTEGAKPKHPGDRFPART